MSDPERRQDDLESTFDWGAVLLDPENVAFNIYARIREMSEEAGIKDYVPEWKEKVYEPPTIVTEGYGNNVVLEVKTSGESNFRRAVPIGYYSPVNEGYVLFPESVHDDEVKVVADAAAEHREAMIRLFDQEGGMAQTRHDYRHPRVHRLHQKHHELTGDRSLLLDVLHKYNEKQRDEKKPEREADTSTQAAICLRKSSGTDHYIAMKVVGWYIPHNGYKKRVIWDAINIAQRDPDLPSGFRPVSGFIKLEDTDEVADLTQGLYALKTQLAVDGEDFCTYNLGVGLGPRRPKKG